MRQPFPYNVRVDTSRGAPMGRADECGDPDYSGKLHLRPVPLDDGYDGGAAYWGCNSRGSYLFCLFAPDRSIIRFFREASARDADTWAREEYPAARINEAR